MYFESRADAGVRLAEQLIDKYRYENSAVLALSDGAVLVAEQISWRLHCVLMLLMSESIEIPGEGLSFGALSQSGQFTTNSQFSDGQRQHFVNEFFGYIEEEKRRAHQRLNRLVGDGGTVDRKMLKGRAVILVSDGITEDLSQLDVALDFLRSVRTKKIIIVSPTASVVAIDRLHISVDEMHILSTKSNFMGVDHYYEDNAVPPREDIITKVSQAVMYWQLF